MDALGSPTGGDVGTGGWSDDEGFGASLGNQREGERERAVGFFVIAYEEEEEEERDAVGFFFFRSTFATNLETWPIFIARDWCRWLQQ